MSKLPVCIMLPSFLSIVDKEVELFADACVGSGDLRDTKRELWLALKEHVDFTIMSLA